MFFNKINFNTVLFDNKGEYVKENDENVNASSENEDPIKCCSISSIYLARMHKKWFYNSVNDFNINDTSIIKQDFDINIKTKKSKLNSFYSKFGTVVKLLYNNRLKIT